MIKDGRVSSSFIMYNMLAPLPVHTEKFLNPAHVLAQAGIRPGMSVADFGCGSGDWVLLASRLVGQEGQVHAVDVQDAALSSVRSRSRMEGVLNINPIRANTEVPRATGLADESQDAVFLSNILFQSRKKEQIIKEAFRVLKPKGILLFADWKQDAPLGPARELRLADRVARELVCASGFIYIKDIEAGKYHCGMIFNRA